MAYDDALSRPIESFREVAQEAGANCDAAVHAWLVEQPHARERLHCLDQLICELKNQGETGHRFDETLCRVAVTAIGDYAHARAFPDLEAWGRCLRELAERHRGHAKIQLELAHGAAIAMMAYGSVHAFADMEKWGRCLRELAARHPERSDIQLQLARGAVNAIRDYGSVQSFTELEVWGGYLRELGECNMEHAEIRIRLASGATNAIISYGSAQTYGQLEAWGQYLREVVTHSAASQTSLRKAA